MWAGTSFADDTEVYASELGEFAQCFDEATQSGVDLDSPDVKDPPVLVSVFPVAPLIQPDIRPAVFRLRKQSVYPPIASPPPRRA